jgi:hypothetical protein
VAANGITAEATDALGAMVSYDVTATDVGGAVPVQCAPSAPPGSPALFLLDQDTTVQCEASDAAGSQTVTASFVVRVRDSTPPTLCALPDRRVDANQPGGALVNFATCASDLVDGAATVSCDHAPGSFFPLGKTPVRCDAVDRHGNKSAPSTFTVTVGDLQPPVLTVPADITVTASKRTGAIVTFTAKAVDDSDPHPKVSCTPPSGTRFPLGITTVVCTATDASGNRSHGSFKVRVVVAWSGLLFPIQSNGGSKIIRGLPLLVRFRLIGGSENIDDLPARLFVAPLNAQGIPGPEKPAVGLPPGVGNLFHQLPLLDEYDLLLDTLSLKAGASQLRVDLGDGEIHTVVINTLF